MLLQRMHLVAVVAAFGMLLAWPPAEGRMLIVPLGARSMGDVVRFATDRDFRLVQQGPLQGSMVVIGRRDRLGAALVADGFLVLATTYAGCGPSVAGAGAS